MSTYPDAPEHRNVDTSIAAADAVALKLGRSQRRPNATGKRAIVWIVA